MRWFKPSLLLPIASLVIDQASAASVTSLFDVLDSGECGAQMNNLNTMLADASTLTTALNQAMTAAQMSTIVGGSKGRDGVVARKLLTKYFGIEFMDAGPGNKKQVPTDDYTKHWTQLNAVYNNLNAFLSSGTLAGPSSVLGDPKPYVACSSSPLQVFGWGSQAFAYNPNYNAATSPAKDKFIGIEIDGRVISIQDVYGREAGTDPYWLEEKSYYEFLPTKYNGDPCYQGGPIAMVLEGRYEHRRVIDGEPIEYAAIEPGVVLCSRLFSKAPLTLSGVTWQDPSTKPQIEDVQPQGSLTLFHELVHMVTWWLGTDLGLTGSGANERQIKVIDITYDMGEILQLAQGTLVKALEPGGPQLSFSSYESTVNAESYTFFAFSWWYYMNIQTSTDSNGQVTQKTPATFYSGYLQEWNARDRMIID